MIEKKNLQFMILIFTILEGWTWGWTLEGQVQLLNGSVRIGLLSKSYTLMLIIGKKHRNATKVERNFRTNELSAKEPKERRFFNLLSLQRKRVKNNRKSCTNHVHLSFSFSFFLSFFFFFFFGKGGKMSRNNIMHLFSSTSGDQLNT